MDLAVLTIFPEMFDPFWQHGIIRRAIEKNLINGHCINIRDFATGRHKVTDDRPYGGGSGMIMKPEPLAAAIRASKKRSPRAKVVLLSPQGRVFDQNLARRLADLNGLIFACGRYEGVDERIAENLIDFEISIGDYVLTGGELGAMVIIDAIVRFIPGSLGGQDAAEEDSFAKGLLEHAHYTRPRSFEGHDVPEVLLSGHHADIEKWRMQTALVRTLFKRPDLLIDKQLHPQEIAIIEKWHRHIETILQSQAPYRTDALSGDQ